MSGLVCDLCSTPITSDQVHLPRPAPPPSRNRDRHGTQRVDALLAQLRRDAVSGMLPSVFANIRAMEMAQAAGGMWEDDGTRGED